MPKRSDPEGHELDNVRKHVRLDGKDVLDLGCGDGRLTRRIARHAGRVVGLDPLEDAIRRGRTGFDADLRKRVPLTMGSADRLPFRDGSFDVAFFTWSLCCIPARDRMEEALREAWRVLRPGGILLNLQPSLQQPFDRGPVAYLITGDPRDLVEDKGQALPFDSRFAVKHAALVQGQFELVGEEEFLVHHYYDTPEEALAYATRNREDAYARLDADTKREIHRRLEAQRTPQGIRTREKALLTVLRKTSSRAVP